MKQAHAGALAISLIVLLSLIVVASAVGCVALVLVLL